jgi:hypothetical protein
VVSFDEFEKEIRRIISEAEKRGLPIRIMGGAAIRIHCPNNKGLYERMKRDPKHDMDFVTYGKFRPLSRKLFVDLGYEPYVSLMLTGSRGRYRQIFNDKEGKRAVDVFLDKLEMNHVLDFSKRLEEDTPTVPLAELLLQKLQIVEINEKDIQDTIILLIEHDVGKTDAEEVNGAYIAGLLANQWGFYHTVEENLIKLKEFIQRYPLKPEEKATVDDRISKLQMMIESQPKTLQWRLRARVGTSTTWYNTVEEVQRG